MISKNLKKFDISGRQYVFDIPVFKELFVAHAREEKSKIGDYEMKIAELLYVDRSTIHNWRNNLNGPGSLDTIKKLSKYWKTPYTSLMKECEETEMTNTHTTETVKFTDREKDAAKRMYAGILGYINTFASQTEDDFYETLEWDETEAQIQDRLKNMLELEYIDLANTVYDSLKTYIENGMEHYFLNDSVMNSEKWSTLTEDEKRDMRMTYCWYGLADGEMDELSIDEQEKWAKNQQLAAVAKAIEELHKIFDPFL